MGKIIHELKKVSGRLIFPSLIQGKTHSEKILLIKDNSIGDFLLFSGILSFYIRHFGDKVYCLVNNNVEEAARLYTENVIAIDNKKYFASLKYRYELLNRLKCMGFGMAVNSILNSSESRDMLYILKIPMTYLYGGVVMELKKRKRWEKRAAIIPSLEMFDKNGVYTRVLSHEKHFMESILKINASYDDIKPYIPLKNTASENVCGRFSLHDGRYFTFSFSSASLKKNYPADKFMEVIGYLHKRLDMKAVVIGHDKYGLAELPDFIVDLRGKTSLSDVFGIIKHSRFFIGNETGTTHASWMMGVPTVMIYGGGHFGGFVPEHSSGHIVYKKMDCYCCNWGCKYGDIPVRCIGEINTGDIIKAAEGLLL